MTKYPRLSSLTNSITENKADNTLTFLVAGKQLTRRIRSEAFSNWSVDSVRVNNQRYLIDTRIEYHTVN